MNDVMEFQKNLDFLKTKYNEDNGMLKSIEEDKYKKETELNLIVDKKTDIGLKKALIKEACKEARKNSKDVFQKISTSALQSIMGNNHSLTIELDETKSAPEVEFSVNVEYPTRTISCDPKDNSGGIADIVSMANLLSMNYLINNGNVAPIFFDEPTKFVSQGFSENVANFLYEVSSDLKKQVFMVTHDALLKNLGDKSFVFSLDSEGRTRVI